MDAKFEHNAVIISLLSQQIALNKEKINKIDSRYQSLYPSYRYMAMIIDALKNNVVLQEEWLNFLEIAGIPEPVCGKTNTPPPDCGQTMTTEYVYSERWMQFTDRLTKSQDEIISRSKLQLQSQEETITRQERMVTDIVSKSEFYMNLQRQLMPQPNHPPPRPEVVEAWMAFMTMVKLAMSETVPGLTRE